MAVMVVFLRSFAQTLPVPHTQTVILDQERDSKLPKVMEVINLFDELASVKPLGASFSTKVDVYLQKPL